MKAQTEIQKLKDDRPALKCPDGMVKTADLCYESSVRTNNWLTALTTCAAAGRRVPSIAETFLFVTDLAAADVTSHLTDNEMRPPANDTNDHTHLLAVTTVSKVTGTIVEGFALKNHEVTYRCVTSPSL